MLPTRGHAVEIFKASAQTSDISIISKQLVKAFNSLFQQRVNFFKTAFFRAIFNNFLQPALSFSEQF